MGSMKLYDTMTDEELVERITANDKQAVDFLMEKYKNLVRQKAKTLYLVGSDKDDLIQEGMIGLYKAIRDFKSDKEASFRHFAEICIMRQMYTAIKSSNTKKNLPLNNYISFDTMMITETSEDDTEMLPELLSEKISNPEQLVIDKETSGMLEYTLVGHLSVMEKEVLYYYLRDYNYSQIATVLGKESKAVDNAIQRIKKKLAQVIQELDV